jgi:hypothetical protein
MILNHISVPVFLLSLAVGLFFVYILGPEEKKIFVYPSPQTVKNTLYKDKADQCFQYEAQKVTCPTNIFLIKKIPMQG